jgi:hypothetical protein
LSDGFNVRGYTCMKTWLNGRKEIFRCTPKHQGSDPWFDWCLVKFRGGVLNDEPLREGIYPAHILGIFQYNTSGIVDSDVRVCVRVSDDCLNMEKFKKEFISKFTVGVSKYEEYAAIEQSSHTVVSAKDICGPLFVFENNGGHVSEYFCSLPRRDWIGYFGTKIKIPRKRKRKNN